MKKKMLISMGLLLMIILAGCSEEETAAKLKSFDVIVYEEVLPTGTGSDEVMELRHKETGCHYIFVDGWETESLVPMFQADGKPYCD
jgi:hypothetical protein